MEESSEVFFMLVQRLRKNEYIIDVDNSMGGEWIEDLIHDILEFKRCIFETKGHYIPFIMAKGCGKGCFVPIRLSDLYLPKTTFHVKLTENHSFIKPI